MPAIMTPTNGLTVIEDFDSLHPPISKYALRSPLMRLSLRSKPEKDKEMRMAQHSPNNNNNHYNRVKLMADRRFSSVPPYSTIGQHEGDNKIEVGLQDLRLRSPRNEERVPAGSPQTPTTPSDKMALIENIENSVPQHLADQIHNKPLAQRGDRRPTGNENSCTNMTNSNSQISGCGMDNSSTSVEAARKSPLMRNQNWSKSLKIQASPKMAPANATHRSHSICSSSQEKRFYRHSYIRGSGGLAESPEEDTMINDLTEPITPLPVTLRENIDRLEQLSEKVESLNRSLSNTVEEGHHIILLGDSKRLQTHKRPTDLQRRLSLLTMHARSAIKEACIAYRDSVITVEEYYLAMCMEERRMLARADSLGQEIETMFPKIQPDAIQRLKSQDSWSGQEDEIWD